MKKIVLCVVFVLILFVGFLILPITNNPNEVNATYLRVHIRANSNDEKDQSIKLEIKNLIVEYLTPKLENVNGLEEAKSIINNNLNNISNLATTFLLENDFSYKAKAKLNVEYFPTRSYEKLTLEDGYYDALIVELGSAKGDNWWCVVYPPLCFFESTKEEKVVYKSLIEELFNKEG